MITHRKPPAVSAGVLADTAALVGGQQVTGWKLKDSAENIYVAKVPTVAGALTSLKSFGSVPAAFGQAGDPVLSPSP